MEAESTAQIEMLNFNCDVQRDSPGPLSKYGAYINGDVTGNVVAFNCCKALM